MKIAIVNTETPGGAFVASQRVCHALQKQGVEVSFVSIKATKWNFLWERFCIWVNNRFSRKNLFAVSIANTGTDISQLPAIQQADIIHLHWINQGGLSLRNIEQLQALGKPIVWTMHDMWPFTGICHHAHNCEKYKTQCSTCPQIAGRLASKVFYEKWNLWKDIHFVGCSQWITKLAESSHLTQKSKVKSIPNPIDTTCYRPIDKQDARRKLGLEEDKKYILFGAMNTTTPMKGFSYLCEADKLIPKDDVQYLVFGKNSADLANLLTHPVINLGYVSGDQRKALIYSAADVFVTPSLADNLPNMIMEAMACGTPCVGFNIGGIPEMIDHKQNGYVAEYKNTDDFAKGIEEVLNNDTFNEKALDKVINHYSESVVAQQYIQLYQSLLE